MKRSNKSESYFVYAFYPHLGIKNRCVTFDDQDEAFSYAGSLRICETPYIILNTEKGVVDIATFQISPDEILKIVESEIAVED